ncbi:MAG TPA: SUMF1/EgtB/PvdO family nonheme iron enzyme, partial [Rectinemataceae bacterium]|nr:SUMF1/EgtB/PvdO family nonheme iron enzyme [Rectinemataceae bacterium]
MGGNAAEWCDDWFGPYSKDAATDPRGPASGKDKVIKGGSFIQEMNSTMPGFRDHAGRFTAWNDTGFRIVRASGPGTSMPIVTTTTTTTTTTTSTTTTTLAIAYGKPELILVEGGSSSGKTIRSFLIGKHEISNAEFSKFADASGYKTSAETGGGGFVYYRDKKTWERKADATWRNPYFLKTDGTPVVQISWYDAVEYCNWLSDRESLPRGYSKQGNTYAVDLNAKGYRLPTEAEWEWAAKGGLKSKGYKYPGSNRSEDVVWSDYWAKGDGPYWGGALKPNELGIYAMCGSVWEWCTELTPQTDKPGTFKAALRGGSWTNTSDYCTIDRRIADFLDSTDFTYGFRVMRLK